MKQILILPFILLHFISSAQAPIDVTHYDFKLTLNDSTDNIVGEASVTLKVLADTDRVRLNLVSRGADRQGMQVSDVSINKNQVRFVQDASFLRIMLNEKAAKDTELTIIIQYSGQPADGLIISKNKFGDRTFFGDNWPNRAQHWLPVIDHPSDKATVDFTVIAPVHYHVIGNGLRVEESLLNKRQKLTHWRETVEIPTKVMVIGAAPFSIRYSSNVNGIPIEDWVYPQNREEGFHDYAAASRILEFFIQHIGPYPYEKLANVQSNTRFGGMENASNIFYYQNSVNGKADHDDLIAHEIAHQWFGNSVSETDWPHVWLSESFATYFTHIYNEYTYGVDRRKSDMLIDRKQVTDFYKKNQAPLVGPVDTTNLIGILNASSYQKGSWVLHMLRNQVGDDAFWEGIREYYSQYKNKNASTAEFQKVMEDAADKKLNTFFEQWAYGPGHPVLETDYKYDSKNKKLYLSVNQVQPGQVFKFKLQVGINVKGQIEANVSEHQIDERKSTITINCDSNPTDVVLDPNVNLLFERK
ncbi:MAG TPA: M1 family metallopeptidase [Chryseosolibacter sp.]|nr:M1 family metallopeptidase [Chryseosolibacter sp.]